MSKPPLAEIQHQFAANIRDPDGSKIPQNIEPRRMKIYQELFYNNIEGFLSDIFPVIRSLYQDNDWQKIVRDFMMAHPCQSPLFAEIPVEFMDYLSGAGKKWLEQKPFLLELAHYEWIELAVSYADETAHARAHGCGSWMNSRPVLSSIVQLLSYRFAVHEIDSERQPATVPDTPTFLAVFRDSGKETTGFLALTPVTHRLLEASDGTILARVIVDQLAREMERSGSELYQFADGILDELYRKGLILGVAPEQ